MQFFSISGRAAWYGKKGTDTEPLPFTPSSAGLQHQGRVQLGTDPSDLGRRKALWGPKYSHFVDVWVAYRYWQNKFGLDHKLGRCVCTVVAGVTQPTSCTESSLYSGITVKF